MKTHMIISFCTTQYFGYVIGCIVGLFIISIILFTIRRERMLKKRFDDRIVEIIEEQSEYLTEKRSKYEGSEQINDKLKPCPICGGKVKLVSFERDSWRGLGCVLTCVNKDCYTYGNHKQLFVEQLPDIIEKWNSMESTNTKRDD